MTLRLLVIGILVVSTPAVADPWDDGVPPETQDAANVLYKQGNVLFAQKAHAAALEKYRAAIALWDHPGIRYNMAVSEMRLDRTLEALDDLERALRYGDAPFTPELYTQALDYLALLGKQVGTIEASCTQSGTSVLLDGKQWLVCPASQRARVLAGEHTLVGEGSGYMTRSRRVFVTGGAAVSEQLALVTERDAMVVTYRYRRWVPFAIAGTGVSIALGGLAFWVAGQNQMDHFDTALAKRCGSGCEPDLSDQPELRDQRDSAQLKGTIATWMVAVGSATGIAGALLVALNRPRRTLPSLSVETGGGATVRVGWTF